MTEAFKDNKTITGNPIIAAQMVTPPIHVPDGLGGAFKTELTTVRTPERTEKYIWWHSGDPRITPHNHPWPFQSMILSGGYTEDRYQVIDGLLVKETRQYREGDVNDCPADVYHVVYDVLPKTATHLICGQQSEGAAWGYLDIETGEVSKAMPDPEFLGHLRAINPHLRLKA